MLRPTSEESRLTIQLLKDLQYMREKYEDSFRLFNQLTVADDESDVKQRAMAAGRSAFKTHLYAQKYLYMMFDKSPAVAAEFAKAQGSTELTAQEQKRLREIEKDLKGKSAFDGEPANLPGKFKAKRPHGGYNHAHGGYGGPAPMQNYAPPVQQQWPPQNWQQFSPYQQPMSGAMERPGPSGGQHNVKKNGKWPAWVNRCNDCDLQGHWAGDGSCPMQRASAPFNISGSN